MPPYLQLAVCMCDQKHWKDILRARVAATWKETCIHVKRVLSAYKKRHIILCARVAATSKETYSYMTRVLSKETCLYAKRSRKNRWYFTYSSRGNMKRDLCICETGPVYMWKETFVHMKRDMEIHMTCSSRGNLKLNLYIHDKGRVYICLRGGYD